MGETWPKGVSSAELESKTTQLCLASNVSELSSLLRIRRTGFVNTFVGVDIPAYFAGLGQSGLRLVHLAFSMARDSDGQFTIGPDLPALTEAGLHRSKIIAAGLASTLLLSGCATTPQGRNAANGALLGGAGGALIGGLASGRGGGALAGGALGAATGAILGAAATPRPAPPVIYAAPPPPVVYAPPPLACRRFSYDPYGDRICIEYYSY